MYKGKKLAVIIPALNEEKLITRTLSGIPDYVDMIIVIDDFSTDKTVEMIKGHAEKDKRIALIQHEKTRGAGGAIISGFKIALQDEEVELISIMDGDDQMRPKHMPDLLDPIVEGKTEFTKGNRLKIGFWKGMSKFRLFGNLLLSFLNKKVSGYWAIEDPQNGYVGICASFLRRMDLDSLYKGYAFENDFMIKANIANVKMQNVLIPAYYAEEQSKLKYGPFITNTSWHLFKSFFSRYWNKYIKTFHIVGILTVLGFLALTSGLIVGGVLAFSHIALILTPCIGFGFLLIAELIDIIIGIRLSK
ncbi:MAG: glycosyltransferase family 2 protein [Asgard group archaeon]|nr:glycosyltransferase family 2 protein [Asgard group archaeon]